MGAPNCSLLIPTSLLRHRGHQDRLDLWVFIVLDAKDSPMTDQAMLLEWERPELSQATGRSYTRQT